MTLKEVLTRIEQLEKENKQLKERVQFLENHKIGGRAKHDKKWQESFNDFVFQYEKGMSVAEIVALGKISRRTVYRYKKYYDEIHSIEMTGED